MPKSSNLLAAFGLGAGLMYWFDPVRGRIRRTLIADQVNHAFHGAGRFVGGGVRDTRNRLQGVKHELQTCGASRSADDATLEQRVRSKMGRYTSHPGAIEVIARNGHITVRGEILSHEVDEFLSAVGSVEGVESVDTHLAVYDDPTGVSSLQGRGQVQGEPLDIMQDNWSPATRLFATGLGSGLMVNCLVRRTPGAVMLGAAGFGLFLRAASNLPVRRLAGLGAERRAVSLHRTFHINAPVERVFEFVTDWDRLADYIPRVARVSDVGGGRIGWTLEVPGGSDVTLAEEITALEPNRLIAWRSIPGNAIGFEGRAQFQAEEENRTRIDVGFSYNPPAGALGHAAAALVGWDPKTQFEQAFIRIKSFLETGKVPHDVEASEVASSPEAASSESAW